MGERDDGRIIGVGQDGQQYFLPKQAIDVRPIDWKARILAAGSLLIAAGALGGLLFKRDDGQKPPDTNLDPGLISTVEAMQTQQAKNLIGDCINENIVRGALGADPVDLKGCTTERDAWAKRFSATPSPTDTPNPIPSNGG